MPFLSDWNRSHTRDLLRGHFVYVQILSATYILVRSHPSPRHLYDVCNHFLMNYLQRYRRSAQWSSLLTDIWWISKEQFWKISFGLEDKNIQFEVGLRLHFLWTGDARCRHAAGSSLWMKSIYVNSLNQSQIKIKFPVKPLNKTIRKVLSYERLPLRASH